MRGKIRFITFLAAIDAYLIAFAVGFNSRHVLMVDPSLPPIKTKAEEKKPVAPPVEKTESKPQAQDKKAGKGKKTTQEHGKKKRKK